MNINSSILFIEINSNDLTFSVGNTFENQNFSLVHSKKIPTKGIDNNKIINLNLVQSIIKENVYSIERKLNMIFKEVILIINNFDCSIVNFSGFKKLNGSQLSKDNITYILNSLKSRITETQENKYIVHK